MKKILFSIVLTLACVSLVSAAAYTAPTGFGIKAIQQNTDTAITLTGIDSTTLFKSEQIDPTATYAIVMNDSIYTGDSLIISLRVYNGSGVKTYQYQEDTIRGVATPGTIYRAVSLPINKTCFGSTMTIKGLTLVAAVSRRVRSCLLYKIIPISGYRPNETRP
jgi:opacity protein-like surface antigen